MRIAYVLLVFPKLSETFILNEIAELVKRGTSKFFIRSMLQI